MAGSNSRSQFSRRAFLLGTLAASAGVLLAACGAPVPTTVPTMVPTPVPTAAPTQIPTVRPTAKPTAVPTAVPTATPKPTAAPTPLGRQRPNPSSPIGMYWDTFRAKPGTPMGDNLPVMFKERYPNITVELRPVTGDQYTKMYGMYAAGTLGDVFNFEQQHHEFWRAVRLGLCKDFDEYAAADAYDFGQFYPRTIDICRSQGKLYALPVTLHLGSDVVFMNDFSLQDAGLQLPDDTKSWWTMDKMYEYMVKTTKVNPPGSADKYRRFGWDGSAGFMKQVIIQRVYGADFFSADGRKSTLLDPTSTAAMKWTYDAFQKDKVVPVPGTYVQTPGLNLWATGRLAMAQMSMIQALTIEESIKDPTLCKPRMIHFPQRPDGRLANQMRVASYQALAKSKYPEYCWEFIKLISSPEGAKLCSLSGYTPLQRKDVLETPQYKNNKLFMALAGSLNDMMPPLEPRNWRGYEYETAFGQNQDAMHQGKVSFDDGMKKTDEALRGILDKEFGPLGS